MIEIAAGIGAALLVAMLVVALYDLVLRPGFRRLAVRNLFRRRTETILVIVGSSLGTAIVASAFLVGATFHASVRDSARTRLGPIDEEVTVAHVHKLGPVTHALRIPPLSHVDGVLPAVRATAAFTSEPVSARPTGSGTHSPDSTGSESLRAEPSATVLELDLTEAQNFGGHPSDTGLASLHGRLTKVQVVIGKDLAATLNAGVGDRVVLHAYGTTRTLTVKAVVPAVGLAGATDAIVAPGVVQAMAADATATRRSEAGVAAPEGVVFVSNNGRVFDSAAKSDRVAAEIHFRLTPKFDVDVTSAKADLLADADQQGRSMGQLFTGVGTFSVLAGLLLLVNLFVMMAIFSWFAVPDRYRHRDHQPSPDSAGR